MTKKKNQIPRRKQMNRAERLQSAKQWLKTYEGKNIIKSYAKWYAVSKICAMTELEIIGVAFSEDIKKEIKRSENGRIHQKQLRMKRCKEKSRLEDNFDFDETFAFIAGYTEGGIPFGITHDEIEE